MIAIWMFYSLAVALLLFIVGSAWEYLARAAGRPTRIGWAVLIVVSLALSGRAAVDQWTGRTDDGTAAATARATNTPQAAAAPRASREHDGSRESGAAGLALIRVRLPLDASRWQHLDVPLGTAAILSSAVALLLLLGGLIRNGSLAHTLSPDLVDGVPVLLSHDLGPLLLGVSRYRVVLPRWVVDLPTQERRLIIAHEQEHARAGDPALLLAGTVAVVLQPWNVALWLMLWRLRLAAEVDCDARVLRARVDNIESRAYGAVLVKVYERSVPGLAGVAAFVARPSHLERRIIRMMSPAPRLRSIRSGATLATAVALSLVTISLHLPAQVPTNPDSLHVVRAAGPGDFEPLARRTVAELFNGITLTKQQYIQALDIVSHTQRAQWALTGQGVPPSKRRPAVANARDSLIALAVHRDSALAEILDTRRAREQFIVRAAQIRQRQFENLRPRGG